jgi:hypothetical protein
LRGFFRFFCDLVDLLRDGFAVCRAVFSSEGLQPARRSGGGQEEDHECMAFHKGVFGYVFSLMLGLPIRQNYAVWWSFTMG